MSPKRIRQRLEHFERALQRLKEVIEEDPKKTSAIIDGTIQRFEFTYELAWKLAKELLNYNGIEANSPRAVIKESFAQNLINDGEEWIRMLEDRNKTSHIYDEQQALKIYTSIKGAYYSLFEDFKNKIREEVLKIE